MNVHFTSQRYSCYSSVVCSGRLVSLSVLARVLGQARLPSTPAHKESLPMSARLRVGVHQGGLYAFATLWQRAAMAPWNRG